MSPAVPHGHEESSRLIPSNANPECPEGVSSTRHVDHTEHRARHMRSIKVACAVAVATAAIAGYAFYSVGVPSSPLAGVALDATTDDTATDDSASANAAIAGGGLSGGEHVRVDLSFTVNNDYTNTYGPSGTDYTWLHSGAGDKGEGTTKGNSRRFLVEPHRRTVFALQELPDYLDSKVAKWSLSAVNDYGEKWDAHRTFTGHEVALKVDHVGHYQIKVEMLSTNYAAFTRGELICRYVRREIRSLFDEDRELFFKAIGSMSNVHGARQGELEYGPRFRSLDYFVRKHLQLAADRESDKMHDGMGFLTSHMALSQEFEDAMQTIHPSVALPYWDFTIDSYVVNKTYGGDYTHLWDSEIWGPEWFGRTDPDNMTITEGRWAFQKISMAENTSSPDSVHNAYGYMRAPWNVNKSPYLTRGHKLCGLSAFEFQGFPTCATHREYVDDTYDSFYDWVWGASYAPHGPVHIVIGGTHNCEDDYMALAEEIGDVALTSIQKASFYTLKSAWRVKVVECPSYCSADTAQEDCTCHCPNIDKIADNLEIFQELLLGLNLATIINIEDFSHANLVKIMRMLCNTGTIPGDQLEAASPVDPTFWPIHPTIDRLFQWKKLQSNFGSEAWESPLGTNMTKYCQIGGCEGHHAYDILPFEVYVMNSDTRAFEYVKMSNAELLDAANPTDSKLPYVYDNFQWTHCDEIGVPLRLKGYDDDSVVSGETQSNHGPLW